jgi:peptidoglycan/xylan/chitin deacetylase (PgdA/CDA1 family)
MTWKRAVLKAGSRLMVRPYRPPSGVLFPCGHIVSDVNPPHVRHLFSPPSVAKFKSDLDFLCQHYRPLQPSELERIRGLNDSKAAACCFLLSFDDGLREAYDVIAPILRSKGIPAIFFLNSATIDNKRLMWRHKVSLLIERSQQTPGRIPSQLTARSTEELTTKLKALRFGDECILDDIARFFELDFDEYLQHARPYLTTAQVLELARDGFEFGSHSESHPYFNEISVEDQKKQISGSVQFIRSLGVPCRCFAFPFHDNGVPGSVFNYMTDLGLVVSFGTSEARLDTIPFSFQRFSLEGSNADLTMQYLLKQLSIKSFVRRLSGTEIIVRD